MSDSTPPPPTAPQAPAAGVRLVDLARVIRSKNAGPLQTTLDLMFADADGLRRALASPSLTAEAVAARYGVPLERVRVVPYEAAHAIKIVLDRDFPAGQPGDRDVYGAQQHLPLLDVML